MSKTAFSKTTTWTIRILCAFVVFIGICLAMLSTLGGTSEHHRLGIEQAFSESLKANVKIGVLEQFNILPQLALQAKDIHGVFRESKNEFMIDKLRIVFSFLDIAFGRNRIEDFQIENFRFSAESQYDLHLTKAGIVKKEKPEFSAKGIFSQRDFDFSMPLALESNGRNVYHFTDSNSFKGHYGAVEYKGNIVPYSSDKSRFIKNLEIRANNKLIATGEGLRDKGNASIDIKCAQKPPAIVQEDFKKLKALTFIKMDKNCL